MDMLNLPKKRIFINQAPAWKRILSFFADLMIIEFILSPFAAIFQDSFPNTQNFIENYSIFTQNPQLYLMSAAIFSMIFLYFVIFEIKLKQTPGKMIFNLHVVSADKAEKLTFIKILIRNASAFPIFPFYVLWILDPLYILFTKRRFSDIISKTTVVEEISL